MNVLLIQMPRFILILTCLVVMGLMNCSGAGATYLVSKALDLKNKDLSALAIVGAIGDLQDRKFCELRGMNTEIVKDGKDAGVLQDN